MTTAQSVSIASAHLPHAIAHKSAATTRDGWKKASSRQQFSITELAHLRAMRTLKIGAFAS
jgi:hypothetical protein